MSAYYNEHDPGAAEWLRELMKAGLIAPGDVDERSIEDVVPSELMGYTQCHFFAGIGVWSYALRLAGWPDDREVWTGSCPCQPFSAAGKGAGFADERHLWPALHHLIRVCRPDTFFGEQVASRDGLGWLDLVQPDLEGEAYAFRAVDLCVAGFGAPHIRQRLWFVADSRRKPLRGSAGRREKAGRWTRIAVAGPGRVSGLDNVLGDGRDAGGRGDGGDVGQLVAAAIAAGRIPDARQQPGCAEHVHKQRQESRRQAAALDAVWSGPCFEAGGMADGDVSSAPRLGTDSGPCERAQGLRCGPEPRRELDGLGDYVGAGLEVGECDGRVQSGALGSREGQAAECGGHAVPIERPGPTNGVWADADWLFCRDEWWRPVEAGTFPLAHGAPGRMGRLRGYGNAISPWPAKALIEARLAEDGGASMTREWSVAARLAIGNGYVQDEVRCTSCAQVFDADVVEDMACPDCGALVVEVPSDGA